MGEKASPSSTHLAFAAANVAAILAVSSSLYNNTAKAEVYLDPNMRALGKSLQVSHERENGMYGTINSLEKLAGEADEKKKTQASNTEEKLADDQ